MKIFLLISLLCLHISRPVYCRHDDYYWKEYFGSIPDDAVVAGRNLDGNKVYIGQGYISNLGIIPGRLLNGSKTINVSSDLKNHVGKFIKVLCGPKENFQWLRATSTTLGSLLGDKQLVIGGHQHAYLGIGRINIGGNIMIGKIDTDNFGNSIFWYSDGNKEYAVSPYEALVYNSEVEVDVDVRIRFDK